VSALTCLRSEGSAVAIESVQSTAERDAEIAEPPATETTY
jgi:hypothetical protein